MNDPNWPNWKEGLIWGSIFGTAAALFWLAASYCISQMEPVTDVSLCLVFRPWWKLWPVAIYAFAIVFVCVGFLGALRPKSSRQKKP